MSKKIKSATLEAIFEDGSTQKLEISGHVAIQTKVSYINPEENGPFAKLGRTITFKDVPESQITEVYTTPEVDQYSSVLAYGRIYVAPVANPRPPARFTVGDIVSLPGSHRFAGRPRNTPSYYRIKDVIWLQVNGRYGVTLETRDGLEVGSPDLSQMSVLTKVDRFPLRKGDFVRFKSSTKGELFKLTERGEIDRTWVLVDSAGDSSKIRWSEDVLDVVPRDQVRVVKTFGPAE
jgi:hypothetical protein